MMFSGKTLLITGGSRGIGKKICFEFAKRGCNIIFTYVRSSSESKKIESELLKFGVNVISKKLNLNSNDDIKKFVENIKNLDIKIDFLINNAASGVMKNSIETTEKHWDWTMQINAKGPWILSKSISKLMPSKSRIINISSPGSTKVLNNYFSIGVSKAALESSVKYLSVDLGGKQIRVNAISAGPMRTLSGAAIANAREVYKFTQEKQ